LTPGVKQIWAVDQRSGGHSLAQAASGGETAGGEAGAAAHRRRAAAQPLNGAGAYRLRWDLHQDDGERPVNTTMGFRGDGGGSTRRAARRRGGGAPARSARRRGARETQQAVPGGPLPHGEASKWHHGNREAATAQFHGSAARDWRRRRELRVWATGEDG
jgi:hypothetical protein